MRCAAAAAGCASGLLLGSLASILLGSTSAKQMHADEFTLPYLSEDERLAAIGLAAPDVAKYLPLNFVPEFDTPCFQDRDGMLRCLPAFFLAGAMQCGTGTLWKRLTRHALIPWHHDALSHWWTLHPKSRAGTLDRYLGLFSNEKTLAALRHEPHSLLGEASQATFTFMMAEQLRLHYLYLDAFSRCHGQCRGRNPPAEYAAACQQKTYDVAHCYAAANNATTPEGFNIPSLIATVLKARPPRVIALLRDPSSRLWSAFWEYGQYPARYGQSHAGFGYYFGNQSASYLQCVATDGRGRRKCAVRFEAYGAAEAGVYYHCDQLVKGMYAAFLPEWQAALPREHLLIMRTEDQIRHPMRVLKRAVAHLQLRPLTDDELQKARGVEVSDEAERVVKKHGLPDAATRERVRAFYHPFNKALARQLDDPAFLWRHVDGWTT